MKLRTAELDGGEYFSGYAVDESGNHLFDVRLHCWLTYKDICVVESLEDGKVYLVSDTYDMKLIHSPQGQERGS